MNLGEVMQEASRGWNRTLAVLSPDYLQSRWAKKELYAALAQDKLLIVRVRDVAVDGLMSAEIHTDLVGLGEADARARLLASFGNEPGPPDRAPRFPPA